MSGYRLGALTNGPPTLESIARAVEAVVERGCCRRGCCRSRCCRGGRCRRGVVCRSAVIEVGVAEVVFVEAAVVEVVLSRGCCRRDFGVAGFLPELFAAPCGVQRGLVWKVVWASKPEARATTRGSMDAVGSDGGVRSLAFFSAFSACSAFSAAWIARSGKGGAGRLSAAADATSGSRVCAAGFGSSARQLMARRARSVDSAARVVAPPPASRSGFGLRFCYRCGGLL